MTTKKPDDRHAKHRAMILDTSRWPKWPWLTLTRKETTDPANPFGDCGLLMATEKPWAEVILWNLFMLPKDPEEFKKLPRRHYDSVDALLADGWVVD